MPINEEDEVMGLAKNLAMARTLRGRICFLRIKRIIDAKLGVMGKAVDGVVLVDESEGRSNLILSAIGR